MITDQESSNQLVIKQSPLGNYMVIAMLLIAAVYTFFLGMPWYIILIFPGVAVLIALLGQSVTVVADRILRTVTITKKSILGSKEIAVPFAEIANFDVETSRTRTSTRNRSVNYRIVLIKTNGEQIPLQDVYTSNFNDKARKAKELAAFLNLAGAEDKPTNIIQEAMQEQIEMTTNPALSQKGTTSGVTWSIDVHSISGKPVTRWFSTEYTCPGNFLLVSQKPANSPSFGVKGIGSGLLGNLMTMVYQQILGIYGFLPGDTPGIASASPVKTRDTLFDENYGTLTSQPGLGQQLLNVWAIQPFNQWASRHPLKAINTNDQVGQLAVLFSPRGLHVAVLGSLPATEFDEIIALGVDLVKAQGSSTSR